MRLARIGTQGFSLMELLVVMAIAATMAGLAVQALGPLVTSNNFNSNVSQAGSLLESAHAAAMSKDTYVWVAMQNQTQGGVAVVMLYSPSGRSSDLATSQAQILSKPIIMRSVKLVTLAQTAIANPNIATFSVADFLNASGQTSFTTPDTGSVSYSASVGGVSESFSNFIEIAPDGKSTVAAQPSAWIQLGLQNLHGNQKEEAIVQMSGLTGKVATYLP